MMVYTKLHYAHVENNSYILVYDFVAYNENPDKTVSYFHLETHQKSIFGVSLFLSGRWQ